MLLNSNQAGINVFAKTDEASDLLNMTLCNTFQGSNLLERVGAFFLPLLRPLCVGCCLYLIMLHAVTFGDTRALRSWRLCCFTSLRAATHLSTKHTIKFLKASGMVLAVFDTQHPTSSSLKRHYANCLPICSVEINTIAG